MVAVLYTHIFGVFEFPPSPLVAQLIRDSSQFGSFGVTGFFVLSAFLLSRILLAEFAQRNQINLTKFYVRRILTILPL